MNLSVLIELLEKRLEHHKYDMPIKIRLADKEEEYHCAGIDVVELADGRKKLILEGDF